MRRERRGKEIEETLLVISSEGGKGER